MTADAAFAEHRDRLFALAYRMLGSAADAEDVVQDAWVRWQGQAAPPDDPGAWLTTVTSRLCLDRLRSARARREVYVGPWLPEPIVTAPDPSAAVELDESVRMAFLVVLETLGPVERAVFLLREVFGLGYPEIAAALGRGEAACRQIAYRARSHVDARRPRFDPDPGQRDEVADRFLQACTSGDLDGLMEVLAGDIVLWSDGGGKARAARRPVHGADRVARFLVAVARKAPAGVRASRVMLNADPGVVFHVEDRPFIALVLEIDDGLVQGLRFVLNPDKLERLPSALSP